MSTPMLSPLPESVADLASSGSILRAGEALQVGECLRSPNRRIAAFVSRDGRFCLCLTESDGRVAQLLAAFPAEGRALDNYFAVLPSDGNFRVHAGAPAACRDAIWSSLPAAAETGEFFAVVQDDGNFSVGRGTGGDPAATPIWQSRTSVRIPADPPPALAKVASAVLAPPPVGAMGPRNEPRPAPYLAPLGKPIILQTADGRGRVIRTAWRVADFLHCLESYVQSREAGIPVVFPAVADLSRRPVYPIAQRPAGLPYDFDVEYEWARDGRTRGTEEMHGSFNGISPRILGAAQFWIGDARVSNDLGSPRRLQFGSPRSPGIKFSLDVAAPEGSTGEFAIIQLVRSRRTLRFPEIGATIAIETAGQWVLDTNLPYSLRTFRVRTPGGRTKIKFIDGPGVTLRQFCNRVTIDDQFRTYLCYKPDAEGDLRMCWMPFARFDWSWAATVERAAGGEWGQPTGVVIPVPGTLGLIGVGAPPAWVGNIAMISEAVTQVLPPGDRGEIPECFTWIRQNVTARVFSGVLAGAALQLRWLLPYLGPHRTDGSSFTVWTSPDDMKALAKFSDFSFVREIPVTDKYPVAKSPHQQRVLSQALKFIVRISPQDLFSTTPEDQELMAEVAPLSLAEITADLIRISIARLNVVFITPIDHAHLRLEFWFAPHRSLLEMLARHPQVAMINVAPEFRFDEPGTAQS